MTLSRRQLFVHGGLASAALACPFPRIALAAEEDAAAREPAELYLRGHATGAAEFFRQAFHPEARLYWIKDGQLASRTSAEYIAGAKGSPADDEARRRRRIVSLDVTNDAAVAKIDLDYPDRHLVDYLALLKIEGRWKIVNKIFTSLPR
jgi:hypothetical protein